MEIKDIRQYRSVYKKEIVECSDTNRNEHFVGMRTKVGEKREYGFLQFVTEIKAVLTTVTESADFWKDFWIWPKTDRLYTNFSRMP